MATPKKNTQSDSKKKSDARNREAANTSEIVQIKQELEALELEEVNPEVFTGVPIQQRQEIIRTMVSYKHHSGPLPDPETLARYNELIPNGAERIMAQAEEQATHRMYLEKIAIPAQVGQSAKGQNYGFILSAMIIVASVFLAYTGHETTACVLGGTTIVSLAIIFVLNKFPKNKKND